MLTFRLTLALFVFLLVPGAAAKDDVTGYRWRNVAIGGGGFVSGLVFHPHEKGSAVRAHRHRRRLPLAAARTALATADGLDGP
ncbi:MAG: hypothetical protein QM795_14245 [Pseudoxanthomonas sp.]